MDGVASSPESWTNIYRTIYHKANDMDRLIDELTFYSKIDTNKIPYTFSRINVANYFRDCIDDGAWSWRPGAWSWDILIMWMRT